MLNWISCLLVILVATRAKAQHCPWDCTGMVLIQTNISKENFQILSPQLVDESKKEIIDTIYGTGKATYDRCEFLYYTDFIEYRTNKIALHHWYAYDTVYRFAEGKYLVKFNYCKYQGKKLFIEFMDPRSRGLKPMYIEVPEANRIHLHNYSDQLYSRDINATREATRSSVLPIDCKKWLLRDCD